MWETILIVIHCLPWFAAWAVVWCKWVNLGHPERRHISLESLERKTTYFVRRRVNYVHVVYYSWKDLSLFRLSRLLAVGGKKVAYAFSIKHTVIFWKNYTSWLFLKKIKVIGCFELKLKEISSWSSGILAIISLEKYIWAIIK